MARARTKKELIDFGEKEYKNLMNLVDNLSESQKTTNYIFENRTAKDIIAHLACWHNLFLNWYKVGMKGEKPEIPAPGYTFKDTPKLNEDLYQQYKNKTWEEVYNEFNKTYKEIMDIIKNHSEQELEGKKKYKWTGTTNLASYLASTTSSHYVWAISLIKKHFK